MKKKFGFSDGLDLLSSTVGIDDPPAVIDVGSDLFESEEFVDTAYQAYLDLMVKAWRGKTQEHFEVQDFGAAYLDGIYICGVQRSIITHEYDPRNDVVPSSFSVWFDGMTDVLREIPRMPKGWRSAAVGRHFRHTVMFKNERTDEGDVTAGVCTLTGDGRIHVAVPMKNGIGTSGVGLPLQRMFASIAVGLYCDRRHLWQVMTSEPVMGKHPTPLCVGVSEEHIKSLFYARSLPITDAGRKRPILHWVKSHQRRLAEGVDVDVKKHLRGTEAFEMGGFDWRIVNPAKDAA